MATFLSKLFKPKWQSKHLETRKQAVELLDGLKSEDISILTELAETDPSPEIQKIAIQKISDTEILISLHKKAKDAFKTDLEKRLYELASAQSLSIFDLILDMNLLTEMIIKANNADSYIRGLARIESPQVLIKIATQSRNAQIRQAAAELIDTEKELHELFDHAKNKDKTVFHIAKNKLAEHRAIALHEAAQQEQILKLLKDLENLSKTEALQHFDARLNHLAKQWLELKKTANTEQSETYSRLHDECNTKLKALNIDTAETPSPKLQKEEEPNASDEISETISAIDTTLKRFQALVAKPLEVSSLDALIKTQENRWIEATKSAEVTKSQQKHYEEGITQLRHYLKALRSFIEKQELLSAAITALLEKGELSAQSLEQARKKLNALIKQINWPTAFLLPETLIDAQNALETSKEMKQALAEKQKVIAERISLQLEKMDAALEEKQIKTAAQVLKEIQVNLSKLDKRQADKFQQGLSLRINQLNELRDWQGFASTPKQESLCEAMERLSEAHIDPMEKADKIKAMQKEWKTLGGTGNQDLWNRFKTASDKAYEPCALFFAEQKQLKETNLSKRKTLLSQLKDYLASIDWEQVSSQNPSPIWNISDWKAADKINRQARQEWKDAFPIDFKTNKSLQTEFNSLMESFDQHLENERSYNIDLKQAIVEDAKSLADADDIEASVHSVKALQDAWQKIGITHHKADRKLWNEYRAACDVIFERRNQLKESKRTELDQHIQAANETCAQIEANAQNLSSLNKDELKSLIGEHRKSIQSLPKLPAKLQEKIVKRIEAVIERINAEIKQKNKHEKLSVWTEVARKSSTMRIAYSEINSSEGLLSNERIAELEQEFISRTALSPKLEDQFVSNWKLLKTGSLDTLNIIDEIQAKELCIACEIAAGLESPDSDKALRMQLQVSRLSEGLSSGSENISRTAQLETAMEKWYLSLGLELSLAKNFDDRIEAAKEALLN